VKINSLNLSLPKYRTDIDGLRAIAVLSVVGFHAFPDWVKGGFIGVDIFFVISGFLISTILFENLEKETFRFFEFYVRRIKRIFPALLLVLVSCYAFGWFALLVDEFKQLGKHIAAGAGFFSNFSLWREAGYFDNAAETKPLLHLWSLGIEEQFYIVWPFLLWVAWKIKLNFLAITGCVALISFFLNIWGIHKDAVATFYSPQTRFWELLVGSLLAWLTINKSTAWGNLNDKFAAGLSKVIFRQAQEYNRYILANAVSILGFLLIAIGIYSINEDAHFPGTWALLPTLGALLIIAAGTKPWLNRVILSNRIFVWFGLISYPLYLWHWPLLSFARIVESETPSVNIRIMAVLLAIVFAWLTYRYVEKPIRFGKKSNFKTIFLIVLMVIVGFGGHITNRHDGFKSRIKLQGRQDLLEIVAHPLPPVKHINCTGLIAEFKELDFNGDDGGCHLSKKVTPTVMFIGDSHLIHYQNAIWKNFESEPILMVAATRCLPFASSYFLRDACKDKYNAVIHFLERNSSVKTVYLSGYWSFLMADGYGKHGVNWRIAKPLNDEGVKSFKTSAVGFFTKILKTKKEIVFMKDIPDLDFDIQSCFSIRPFTLTKKENIRNECSWDFKQYQKRIAPYDKVVDEVLGSFPMVKVYDPRPLFCRDAKCFASDGSLPYYFNGDHVNHYGADLIFKDMLEKT
jgi:peptidoglycan/LPS O-acetylase OafA/YrhL